MDQRIFLTDLSLEKERCLNGLKENTCYSNFCFAKLEIEYNINQADKQFDELISKKVIIILKNYKLYNRICIYYYDNIYTLFNLYI